MKWISFLLSIYVVALSCIPCMENNDGYVAAQNYFKTSSLQVEHAHSHDQSEKNHTEDNCSPFCNCNCSGAHIISFVPTVALELSYTIKKFQVKKGAYKFIFTSNFFGSIWQPPQIV